jgi:hypothetical protein
MEYHLAKSDNIETFINEVYFKLNSGWKPHGDIFTFKKNNKTVNQLALIKEGQPKTIVPDKTVEEILASWNC